MLGVATFIGYNITWAGGSSSWTPIYRLPLAPPAWWPLELITAFSHTWIASDHVHGYALRVLAFP